MKGNHQEASALTGCVVLLDKAKEQIRKQALWFDVIPAVRQEEDQVCRAQQGA